MGFKTWLLLVLSLLPGILQAATPAQNLNRLLGDIDSLSAQFEQLVLDGGGTRLQHSTGTMELARPGQFRWQTDEPFPQLLVSDGQTLWLYDQDLGQVTQQPLDGQLSNTPALLLSGDLIALEDSFDVFGPNEGDEGAYRLEPKADDALFEVLRILFQAGLPIEMQLEDNLGQKTSVHFNAIELNPQLPSDYFHFDPPVGVDLIQQ